MTFLSFLLNTLTYFFGIQQPNIYDVIVIGAGAAGSPLAQTIAEGGLKVVLLERGPEQVVSSQYKITSLDALRDGCAENIRSKTGLTVTTGNCMGGATSVNHGIYVQEQPDWFQLVTSMNGDTTLTIEEIVAAFDWIRERVAPEPASEPAGSAAKGYIQNLINIFGNHSGFVMANVTPGQYDLEVNGVWRTHSTFHPITGRRRSSDTLLDRSNPNLEIRTNSMVSEILFDGDSNIPSNIQIQPTTSSVPQARCVRLADLELLCVKNGGRIYISAGAINTPALLMKSGIGPNGSLIDNPAVGTNLVDKPAILLAGSYQHNESILTFSHIAASQQGVGGTQLIEELSAGVDAMLTLAAWQRNFVPSSIRNTLFATAATQLIDFCSNNIRNHPNDPSVACNQVEPVVRGGCTTKIFGVACLIGEPTSRGTVTLNQLGQVEVDVNYLSTDQDKQAFGNTVRTGYDIVTAHSGISAPQLPCSDKSYEQCLVSSCPDLIEEYVEFTRKSLRLALPRQAYKMKAAPASVIYPQFIQPALENRSNTDLAIGQLVSDEIFAAHHLAGSASIGTVVDSSQSFQVIGVNGLHVVDASIIPTTPRGNPMAMVMALGRIAGLQAVAEITTGR